MLDHTDPVASIIPAMSLDSPSDSAMTALSRLALGPVNTAYYLAVFERFDNTGRTTTTWNWAACIATLNWMLFRQLWTPALIYLAAAEGLALIVYGIGRTFLQWPLGVELGVLGAFAMLAFVVPGLYGNAILYADIRKRVARALAASRTLPEASALLEKQASSRKRLRAVVRGNLALAAAAAAVLAYFVWVPSDTKPLALEPAVTVAQATLAAASRPTSPASAPTAAAPLEPAPVPAQEPPTAPAAAASAPMTSPTPAPAAAAPPAPPAPLQPASATRPPTDDSRPAAAPTAPAASKKPPAAPVAAVAGASKPAAKTVPATEPASRAVAPPKARAPKAASAAEPTASAPLPTVGTAAGYYINVGLFADEANARKAQARLLNEGLPAFRQELNTSSGRRIRVRVGPYPGRAEADTAAASIRSLGLDAVVFRQARK
ncbi:MAG: SPOR domain-containing protein [Burkholderiaceae bacterium]|nr:SPOR domain-containing protein [Burkholderiaceae bacterium]